MIKHTRLVLSFLLLIAYTFIATASDVDYYLAVKGQNLRQTNSGTPVIITNESPFRFIAEVVATTTNGVTNVILKLPSKSSISLTNQAGEDETADFAYEAGFTNKALLENAFASGGYNFIIRALNDGSNSATITLPTDAYPTAPHISNWRDAQEIESTLPFVIHWDASTNIGASDFVFLDVANTNGDGVLKTGNLFSTNALTGTNLSVVIPADQLDPDKNYEAQLLYVKIKARNTNSVPGVTGIGGFFRQTKFPLTTLPNPVSGSRVQFDAYNYSALETDGGATVTVTRTGDEGNSVSVNLITSDGSAVNGTNYQGISTTLTFDSNITSTNIVIPVLNDYKAVGSKTVNLLLTGLAGNAFYGNRSNALLTILDAQKAAAGKIQFSKSSNGIAESATSVILGISRIGTAGAVSVHFHTEDGAAKAGLDYIATNGTIVIGDKKTTATLPIGIINDSLHESNENFYVVLDSTTGGASLGTNTTTMVNIIDNDPGGVISLNSAAYTTNENSGFFLVSVKRSPVTTGTLAGEASVDFTTINGTALAGADYTTTNGTLTFGSNELVKTVQVLLTNDTLAEGDENLFFQISNPQGGASLGAITNATLTIKDDESSISISNAAVSVSESGTNVAITLVRSGALLTSVSVDFATINGTATAGSDYTATNGTVTFPANTSSKTIIVPITSDGSIEGNETFSFSISNPQGGVLLGATTNEVVTITDDDFAGTVQFASSTFSGTEGSNAVIKIVRTGGKAGGQSVYFQMLPVTANAGVDYTNVSGYVNFAAGETNKTILVPLILDSLNESTETVTLLLNTPSGGVSIGVTNPATLNINNKPDPNAVPITGPIFMSGKVNGVAFSINPASDPTGNVQAALFTSGNAMNLVASWSVTGGKIVQSHLLTIDPSPFALGTYNLDNNSSTHGFMSYLRSDTDITDPFHPKQTSHAYAVASGGDSVGSYGTFIYDAIDDVNKMVSGRFTFHMRETTDTVAPNGGFIDMSGSFRCHYQ